MARLERETEECCNVLKPAEARRVHGSSSRRHPDEGGRSRSSALTLRDVEALGTAVRTGYVIERAEALEELTTLSVDYLVPSMALVRAGILEEETVRGLPGLVWTVNEEADFGAVMADRRVSGIITDRPELAMSVRDTVLLDP